MADPIRIGVQLRRVGQPGLEAARHLWLELAETAVPRPWRVLLVVDDAGNVQARLPLGAREERQIEPDPTFLELTVATPHQVRCSPQSPTLTRQGGLALAKFDACFPVPPGVQLLDLEDVGEVAAEGHLDRQPLVDLRVVSNPQILVDTPGDDPVALDRDRRIQAHPGGRERSEDPRRVVVDHPAGQDPQRFAVDRHRQGRQMANILEEQATRAFTSNVAGAIGEEECAPVEHDEVIGHEAHCAAD